MYGCFPPKLAETLGKDKAEGESLFNLFWGVNQPIKLLIDDLEKAYAKSGGTLKSIDGRMLYVREKRTLLNTLLQQAGAMVFKTWMVACDDWLACFDFKIGQIIAYHDELQFESHEDLDTTTHIAGVFCSKALDAGRSLGICVSTPADYKIGMNWAETH